MSAGSFLMMGLEGETLTYQEKFLIEKEDIGGIILFKRNGSSYKALKQLIAELYSLKVTSPLIIAIDREGGVVDRLNEIKEFYPWPNPSTLSKICTTVEIEKTSYYLHQELKHLGINMNLNPCLDIFNPHSLVLKGRTFSNNPWKVGLIGKFVIQGARRAGVLTCAKHFPGHGGVAEDSHQTLPVDLRTSAQILHTALPFRQAFAEHVPSVMAAHIFYPSIDSQNIAPLSPIILSDLLKNQMGFQGLVLTDDLEMKAVQNYPKDKLIRNALTAGVHIFISGQNQETTLKILNHLKTNKNNPLIEKRRKEIMNFKKKYSMVLSHSSNVLLNPERRIWFEELSHRIHN